MTTVTGKLIGTASPQRVEMKATLVDVTGQPAVGYVSSVPGEVVQPKPITPGSDGSWTVDLTPNSGITSDAGDTLWAIVEGRTLSGTPIVSYVAVPDTGSHWVGSIRADLSDTQTGQGTVVYLPGPAGPAGATGPAGTAGTDGTDGTDGQDGASAYQVAVAAGFTGTEAEWLATLVGPQGDQGPEGPQPQLGAAGAGADIALRSTDPTTTNARTPTVHAASHASGGTDPVTPAAIGADPAGTAATTVSTHTAAADPHGDRTWANGQFATITTVSNIDTFLNDCLTRVAAIEQGTAWLTGVNSTGPVNIVGDNLTISRDDPESLGAYRFRTTGGGLDLEVAGLDVIVSHWSNPDFTGTQKALMRWEAAGPHLIGRTQFGTSPYDTVFDLDAAGNKLGLFGVASVARQVVTGSWADGTALQSLLAALEAYGLIDDQTTA